MSQDIELTLPEVEEYWELKWPAYCIVCTEKIEFCRCEIGKGANRL